MMGGTPSDEEVVTVCCDQLICARCTGPVSEGRCSSCRAARAELHGASRHATDWILLALIALALTVAFLVAAHPA
jgi:hypothetical protein